MAEGLRIIAVCFVDVIIGVLLIVLGCILGSALHDALTPDIRFLYGFWFIVALLPFVHYVKWRQVMNFDWWDVLVHGGMVFFAMSLAGTLPQILIPFEAMLRISIIVFVASRWEKYRETTFPRPNQTAEPTAYN